MSGWGMLREATQLLFFFISGSFSSASYPHISNYWRVKGPRLNQFRKASIPVKPVEPQFQTEWFATEEHQCIQRRITLRLILPIRADRTNWPSMQELQPLLRLKGDGKESSCCALKNCCCIHRRANCTTGEARKSCSQASTRVNGHHCPQWKRERYWSSK
jgi:hypothetical protein